MSGPIAIPSSNRRSRETSPAARSLPASSSGLYVPVHRRGASASYSSDSISSISTRDMTPKSRTRSASPFASNHLDNIHIPTASTIPTASRIYSPSALLALSSSPSIGLSPVQRAQLDAHIPLMLPRASSLSPRSKTITGERAHADSRKRDSTSEAPRRRRTGRKANARVAPAVSADVDGRRRRNAYGAGWGWSPAERIAGQRAEFGRVPIRGESWRMVALAV
ncbi:hypothetical protein C8Q79DRAFT_304443 [Trametes meyenii]|nr:hypothetical protein C8Q79DRAFT_304443 [Trametes meyenii]